MEQKNEFNNGICVIFDFQLAVKLRIIKPNFIKFQGVRRKCGCYKMLLTAFSLIEGSCLSPGKYLPTFSPSNRRHAFNVSDDILIKIQGYTIVFESRSEKK